MSRKISESSPRNYFTKETEEYIIQFNLSEDPEERNRIFTDHIYFPLYKLAENIIHTFKFYRTDLDTIEDLKLDIISMLYQEKLKLFDPSRGAKAFSYFGTIIKRYLIAYSKKNYLKQQQCLPVEIYESNISGGNQMEMTAMMTLSSFMDNWILEVVDSLPELFPKEQDRQIADAVLTVFRTRKDLELFKKKAIYIYVREITQCETPYLTKVILKLKNHFYARYLRFKEEGLIEESSS